MRLLAAADHKPILPESAELVNAIFAVAYLLVPILVIAFVIRQVVMTRRAAERAADAAERLLPPR